MARRRPAYLSLSDGQPMLALNYFRISGTERQREGASIEAQTGDVRAYDKRHGFVIDGEFQDVLTGKKDARPGYQALLSRVRELRAQGKPVAVVCKWLDRFGRNMLERVRSFKELQALGAELHSVAEGGRVPELVANILASVAEEESRRTGERVSDMARYHNDLGWLAGRKPNWGYRWRDTTEAERALGAPKRTIEPDPDEAPFVRDLWRRAAAGESTRRLFRWATALPLGARGGRVVSFATVWKLLRSPVYVGRVGDGEDVSPGEDVLLRPRGQWEALVDDGTWRAVRDRQEQARAVPRQASGRFLLTGMVYCPVCEGRLVGSTQRTRELTAGGKGATYEASRYRCYAVLMPAVAEGQPRTCTRSVHAPSLEADVLAQVGGAVATLLAVDPQTEAELRRWWAREQAAAASGGPDVSRRLATLETARGALTSRLARAAGLFADGELDKPGYEALRGEIETETAALDAERATLVASVAPRAKLPDLDVLLGKLAGWARALEGASLAGRREVLAALTRRIVPEREGPGRYRARIAWTGEGEALASLAGYVAAA